MDFCKFWIFFFFTGIGVWTLTAGEEVPLLGIKESKDESDTVLTGGFVVGATGAKFVLASNSSCVTPKPVMKLSKAKSCTGFGPCGICSLSLPVSCSWPEPSLEFGFS